MCKILFTHWRFTIPLFHGICSPLWLFICMTKRTGIGYFFHFYRNIWSGQTERVVITAVYTHIDTCRHMTADTGASGTSFFMFMMRSCRVLLFRMTLGTDFIPFRFTLKSMWVMAVRTSHSCCIHLTLQKGVIDIHFILYLSIGEIKTLLKLYSKIMVRKLVSRNIIVIELRTSGVTFGTDF